jgi:hypothetical protein
MLAQELAGQVGATAVVVRDHKMELLSEQCLSLWMRAGRGVPSRLPSQVSSKAGAGTLAGKVRPVLTVVQDGSSGDEPAAPGLLIDEIVREGALRMLAEALRAEVEAYVAAFAGERDENGRRLVVRNGYRESLEVLTSANAVEVTAPRVNDKCTDPVTGAVSAPQLVALLRAGATFVNGELAERPAEAAA